MGRNRSSGNTIASRGGSSGSGTSDGPGFGGGGAGGGMLGGIGGIGGEIANEEISNRIDERMQEAQTVEVELPSRTRGMMERLQVQFDPSTPGIVQVHSESGNTYQVDTEENTCTCPDHRFRESRCRHIEASGLASEQIAQGTSMGSATPEQINVNETLRDHIANEANEEQANVERGFSDDGHFYSDNPAEFMGDMERLRNEPIPYQYENALNGSDITFGIELEFINGDSAAIARELFDLGICQRPYMEGYHSRSIPGKWKVERDGSVTDIRNRGGEIVSPVLRDTPETWRQIETICEVARRHGGDVDMRTGSHVHISAEPLDGKRQRWKRLFKAFKGTEEAVFRYSGGEQGVYRNTHYSASSQDDLNRAIRARLIDEGSMNDFREAIRSDTGVYWQKYRSINFKPFTENVRDCIEIRAFNGSLTPGVIQGNVKVAAGLIHSAERSRRQGDDAGPTTPFFKKRGKMIEDHHMNSKNNDTMIRMLDTYFTRKSDKEHILNIMAKNRWR